MMNGYDDFQKMTKGNVDLVVKGFGELSKGMQAMAAEIVDYSKKNLENGAASAEKMLTAGTIDKVLEVQAEYFRASYENYVAQINKSFAVGMNSAKDAFRPVMTTVSTASTKASKAS